MIDAPARHSAATLRGAIAVAATFAVGFAIRLSYVATSSGGLRGDLGYDTSVYYSAADALLGGRMPYRDFVLLHPPTIMLVLTPFAELGRLTTDHTGFVAATLAFIGLGAVNAVLVLRIGERMGFDRRAALAGALFYAVWSGSVRAEFLARLEPLGNFFVLLGLLAYYARRPGSRWMAFASGLAFGAAASVKIWWSVPLVILLAAHLLRRRWHDLARFAGGAAAAMVVVNAPFFALAPSRMWHMVIAEQVSRVSRGFPLDVRLIRISGLSTLAPDLSPGATAAVLAAVCTLFAAVLIRAWWVRPVRLVVALAVGELILLLSAPACFAQYADFLAPAVALSVAAAVSRRPNAHRERAERAPLRWIGWCATGTAAAMTVATIALGQTHASKPFPAARLAAAVRSAHCVMSDYPMALILLDTLSRDLRDGCPNWVDVTGRTYGVDAAYRPDGVAYTRAENPRWQRDLLAYLESGEAALVVRADTGINRRTLATLRAGGVLVRVGRHVVYRTGPAQLTKPASAEIQLRNRSPY